jgi:cytochrome c oxidase assembly protein subunit 15
MQMRPSTARRSSSVTRFQRLALWTTALTYFLILVGGLVRASGAGLGCPDWPRCFGSWIPPLSAAELPPAFDRTQFNPVLMWTEYLNRLLGVTVGFFIFATLVVAVRDHRHTPRILWPTLAAFVLVGFEGWLGGMVVAHELASWIVTVHLVVALIIVSLLLYATLYAFFGGARSSAPHRRAALAWTTLVLIVITLGQIALGAQVRGGIDDAIAAGSARSTALAAVGDYDRWHREGALVVLGLVLIVVLQVWNRYGSEIALVRAASVVVALVVTQLSVGVSLAYAGLTPAAQVAHLTAASLLLGAQTVMFLLARWLP